MAFTSVEGLLRAAAAAPLWQAVQNDDIRDRGADAAESWGQMARLWAAMTESVAQYSPRLRSSSDLVGGEGGLVAEQGGGLCGPFFSAVIATALKTGECNACMRRIVAAPTAGASGVLPAVLLPLQQRDGLSDEVMTQALYVAAGFGQVIASRASISGAEGGCQAEVGSASGMAAAAKRAGPGVRPGGRAGGGALRQAQRDGGGERPVLRRDGPVRRQERHSLRRGH